MLIELKCRGAFDDPEHGDGTDGVWWNEWRPAREWQRDTTGERGDSPILGTNRSSTAELAALAARQKAAAAPALAWLRQSRFESPVLHVLAAQVEAERILIRHDHVIAHMLEHLGATVTAVTAPFDPEAGAYGDAHSHSHGSGHDHSH